MCGIAGVYSFNDSISNTEGLKEALVKLGKRGPDGSGIYIDKQVALGHTRLSIIDTSDLAAQPFTDDSGRYTIIFNGEFFNFLEHRKSLSESGVKFRSSSDTEVLLQLYIKEGAECLEKLNGFFALAIYDKLNNTLFLARDRMGVKPLFYYKDEHQFVFASEMKALQQLGVSKELDLESLEQYLHLNYIPAPNTIFKNVKKMERGNYFLLKDASFKRIIYYEIADSSLRFALDNNYTDAKNKLHNLLEDAVKLRLISDVPLGCFLSGGIDSSVIAALASKHTNDLQTFSIGFKDEPFFDETKYAEMVAKKHQTKHSVFYLSNNDLYAHLHEMLDYIDEPFADSSALAVYILSKETRKKVTVALSGDGADELFAGYNKHYAAYNSREINFTNKIIKNTGLIWKMLPKSRNSNFSNLIRKIEKYSSGLNLDDKERYWRWAGFTEGHQAHEMIHPDLATKINIKEIDQRKSHILRHINSSINSILQSDMELVLANDMLTKVDMMSMANSLEVRTPFLDYRLVDFAFSLPESYKIDKENRKKIVKDTFGYLLPDELLTRKKQGFEVPLLSWFKTELKSTIEELLGDKFLEEQKIFNSASVRKLKSKLYSANPEDSVARVWALLVFQWWWKNLNGTQHHH